MAMDTPQAVAVRRARCVAVSPTQTCGVDVPSVPAGPQAAEGASTCCARMWSDAFACSVCVRSVSWSSHRAMRRPTVAACPTRFRMALALCSPTTSRVAPASRVALASRAAPAAASRAAATRRCASAAPRLGLSVPRPAPSALLPLCCPLCAARSDLLGPTPSVLLPRTCAIPPRPPRTRRDPHRSVREAMRVTSSSA